MKLITAGRKDVTAFFEMSGIRFKKKQVHHPFIVFRQREEGVAVELIDNAAELVKLPAKTKVMAQWPGKSRSDFFRFTVGQFRKHVKDNPKHACQVV